MVMIFMFSQNISVQCRVVFLICSGLDEAIEYAPPERRILRKISPLGSNSQVQNPPSRSTYEDTLKYSIIVGRLRALSTPRTRIEYRLRELSIILAYA